MKKILIIITFLFIILSGITLYVNSFEKQDNYSIDITCYDTRKFFTAYDTSYKSAEDYFDNKYENRPGEQEVISFPDTDIVFECAWVGYGISKEKTAYYAILYKDMTLRYIKGDMISPTPFLHQNIFDAEVKYYENKEGSHIDILAFSNYEIGKNKMSRREFNYFINKLNLVEKYYPYKNEYFNRETNEEFEGYYYNNHYYGMPGYYNNILSDMYFDSFYFIESLIGIDIP